MTSILLLDRETWNERDLTEVGTYRYAETAEDLLLSYAIEDGPAKVWDCTEDPLIPADLNYALKHVDEVWAHHASFDRAVHESVNQAHLPQVALERWRCSMSLAMSHALPGQLAALCEVLQVPEEASKQKEGKKLIKLFTMPQPANRKLRRATRFTHPAEWARFVEYARMDIVAMRECMRRIPRWNWNEQAVKEYIADQRSNSLGFAVDRDLVDRAVIASRNEQARLLTRFKELTGGQIAPTQRDKLKQLLNDRYKLGVDNTTADTFTQIIKHRGKDLDPVCVELMQLVMAANKTSTAKYAALKPAIMDDDRFRGALQFAGAGRTRRWAGRLFQAHNLPARGLPPAAKVEQFIEAVKLDVHDLVFGDEMQRLSSAALRGVVVPAPGKKLVVADLSNIEGRKLSWFAREEWKLQAFRDYDAGTGPDLYKITAASILGGDPWKVGKTDRDVFGKVPDLASGYQGGVAGYQKFAKNYGVRMADHWHTMQRALPQHIIEKSLYNLDKYGHEQAEDLEISATEWQASEACKLAWRERHPKTEKLWYALQDAAKQAIRNPGVMFPVGPLLKVRVVKYKGNVWMLIRLPSSQVLTYFEPHIMGDGTLAYWGEAAEEGKTHRTWQRVFTHGGKLTGNVCQTSARDTLAPALIDAYDAGYPYVLSVHDEAICEVEDNEAYTSEALVAMLSVHRDWMTDLPLAAAGFETYRYKKE